MRVKTGLDKPRVRVRTFRRDHSVRKSAPSEGHWTPIRTEMIEKCMAQRSETISRIFREHTVSYHMLEDCFGRTILKLCKTDAKYVERIEDPRKYMYVGTLMELRSELRTLRNKLSFYPLEDSLDKEDVVSISPFEVAVKTAEFERVMEVMENLRPLHQLGHRALVEFSMNCKSFKEIAKELNLTEAAVKNRVIRYRQELFRNLPEDIRAQFARNYRG